MLFYFSKNANFRLGRCHQHSEREPKKSPLWTWAGMGNLKIHRGMFCLLGLGGNHGVLFDLNERKQAKVLTIFLVEQRHLKNGYKRMDQQTGKGWTGKRTK